jgi:hypothetical protein
MSMKFKVAETTTSRTRAYTLDHNTTKKFEKKDKIKTKRNKKRTTSSHAEATKNHKAKETVRHTGHLCRRRRRRRAETKV